MLVLGAPAFYARFGFGAAAAAPRAAPFGGPAFMRLELWPGVLAPGGEVRYAMGFGLDG
jgi:predicted N-acetyltransferase YhbS